MTINQQDLIKEITAYIDDYKASRTEENKVFVDGVVYGMNIILARVKKRCAQVDNIQDDNYASDWEKE